MNEKNTTLIILYFNIQIKILKILIKIFKN
jgi:hypothetical protein